MTDTDVQAVAEIQLTAEILDKLGVIGDMTTRTPQGNYAKSTEERIDQYGKHFLALFKIIHQRYG